MNRLEDLARRADHMQRDMTTVLTIDQLRETIAPIARSLGFERVWLFGSYARGCARPDSDIDLLVDASDPAVSRMADLAREVEAATNKEAEAFTWQGLTPESFQEKCRRESVPLWDSGMACDLE